MKMPVNDKVCFVISPIGPEDSPIRKRSDDLFDFIISPVITELGMIPQRADKLGFPGNITTQIIVKLVESELVIADLSDHNANVFYELAIRHAIRKPVVHMITRGTELPFDIKTYRAISYDVTDYRLQQPAQKELRNQVENQLNEPNVISSPFSDALPILEFERSTNPRDREMREILLSLESVKQEIFVLGKKFDEGNLQQRFYSNKSDVAKDINLSYLEGRRSMILDEIGKLNRHQTLTKDQAERIRYLKRDLNMVEQDIQVLKR